MAVLSRYEIKTEGHSGVVKVSDEKNLKHIFVAISFIKRLLVLVLLNWLKWTV